MEQKAEASSSSSAKVFNSKKVIEHIQSNDKALCLATLSQLTQLKNVNVIPREVVECILALLKSTETSRILLITSLMVLSHFANFDRTKMMMGEMGVFEIIVPLLNSYTEVIKIKTVEVILALCTNSKNQVKLVESMLKTQDTKTDETAEDEFQVLLPLFGLIQREDRELQEKAMTVLFALFKNRQCVEIIAQDDRVMEALTMLLEVKEKHKKMFALSLLTYMTDHFGSYCKNWLELNGIEFILENLKVQLETAEMDVELVVTSLRLLSKVAAMRDSYRIWVGEHQGINTLTRLLVKVLQAPKERKKFRDVMIEQQKQILKLKETESNTVSTASTVSTPEDEEEPSTPDTPLAPPSSDKHSSSSSSKAAIAIDDTHSTILEEVHEEKRKGFTIVEESDDSQLIIIYYCLKTLAIITEEASGKDTGLLRLNKDEILAKDGMKLVMDILGSNKLSEDEAGNYVRDEGIKLISNISGHDASSKAVDKEILDSLLKYLTGEGLENLSEYQKKQKRKHAVKALVSYAKLEESVITLIDLGVISKLLSLIKARHEASAVVANILAELNSHTDFQRVLYDHYKTEEGLGIFLEMVKTGNEELGERIAGLNALHPFCTSANGRIVLHSEGIFADLKKLVDAYTAETEAKLHVLKERADKRNERKNARKRRIAYIQLMSKEQAKAKLMGRAGSFAQSSKSPAIPKPKESEDIDNITEEMDEQEEREDASEKKKLEAVPEYIELAKSMLRKAKKEHDATKKLNLETSTPFSLDYNTINYIDKDLITHCQYLLQQESMTSKTKLSINWKFLDRLPDAKAWDEMQRKKRMSKEAVPTMVHLPSEDSHSKRGSFKRKSTNLSIPPAEDEIKVEKQENPETKEEALHLLSRENIWKELALALQIYANSCDPNAAYAFSTQVRQIVVEVNAKPSIEVQNLVMKYSIGFQELWSPKKIAGAIAEILLGYDVTMFDVDDDVDEQYSIAINSLKKQCKDTRIFLIGDINALLFHLEMNSDALYNPVSLHDENSIFAAKGIIMNRSKELFIKGWILSKLNKQGVAKERVLILTNFAFYTVVINHKQKKLDFEKSKCYSFKDYVLTDVGPLVTKQDVKHKDEKLRMEYLAYLITEEEKFAAGAEATLAATPRSSRLSARKSSSRSMKAFDEEAFVQWKKQNETSFIDTDSSVKNWAMCVAMKNKEVKMMTPNEKRKSLKRSSVSLRQSLRLPEPIPEENSDVVTESLREETSLMHGEERIQEDKHPETEGLHKLYFLPPPSLPSNKHKLFLEEIAWCLYATASSYQRAPIHEPYAAEILKPSKENLLSALQTLSKRLSMKV